MGLSAVDVYLDRLSVNPTEMIEQSRNRQTPAVNFACSTMCYVSA